MTSKTSTFYADAVLFDMDGTLTDSIAAVEAAWAKVAQDLGLDPAEVIAATHGKRAIDNLAQFKSHLKAGTNEMEEEVMRFEQTILDYADAFTRSGGNPYAGVRTSPTDGKSSPMRSAYWDSLTPALTPTSNAATPTSASSRGSSFAAQQAHRPSFATRLSNMLTASLSQSATTDSSMMESALTDDSDEDDVIIIDGSEPIETSRSLGSAKDITTKGKARRDAQIAWSIEADGIDRSIRILPGVRDMLASIPEGQYAVATSGAKTYAHGALTRVGITPPRITITADDPRLLRGKPFPDPFLLAASCLGYPIEHCVVFEDSPSGIRAGVASGATVIAVCTSHEKDKIEGMGAHYLVKDMRSVKCDVVDGRLEFTVDEESW